MFRSRALAVVAFVVIVGAFIAAWLLGSATHHDGAAASDPDWAERLTAISTTFLVVAALFALWGVSETRSARIAQNMGELSQRWDSPEFRAIRRELRPFSTSSSLRTEIERLYLLNSPDYYRFLVEPGYLEDIAINVKHHGLDFAIVCESLGYLVVEKWAYWHDTIRYLRERDRQPVRFEHFESLVKKIDRRLKWKRMRRSLLGRVRLERR